MKSVYNFVVKPKGERYNNTKKLDGGELILNTEIFNHQYVNREAIVISTPVIGDTDIKPGDTVIVHHNVFRRWHNQYGEEKNSRSYFNEDTYLVNHDQIFLYKKDCITYIKDHTLSPPHKNAIDQRFARTGFFRFFWGGSKKSRFWGGEC